MDVASPSLLARLESMPREEFLAFQLAKLKRQVARVYATNAFYRDTWDAAGAHPDEIRTLDDFRQRIPTVGKGDFVADQAAHPPFGRRLGIAREDVAMVTMTSGTAGQGQEVYGRTAADIVIHAHLHWLPCHLAGLRRGDVVFNCAPTGGLTSGGWGLPDGFRHGGATAFHVGGVMSTDAKIDLMLRFGEMHFVYASTNYLHTLTEAMRRRGLSPREKFPMLCALYISAEGYSPAWAQAMEEFWGCGLHEGYGSTQAVGFALTSCPSGRTNGLRLLHALEWMNLCEVIDPETGEPVGPGEEGELILTNLDITGSPCIRFATRDRVRYLPHDACGCGRPWACVEAGTIGRYDDMMKIRGNNVWPTAIDQLLFAQPEVAEYAGRVFVDAAGRTEVSVRVALTSAARAAAPATREEVLRRLARLLKDKTNVAMRLEEVDRSELPTFAYKSRRWQDERRQGYDRAGKGST